MVSNEEEIQSTTVAVPTTAPEIESNNKDVSSNLNVVADDIYNDDLAITNTGVNLEEGANSNSNWIAVDVDVDVDDEYWKEVSNDPIIVTNSPNPENNSSPRIWNIFDSSSKF